MEDGQTLTNIERAMADGLALHEQRRMGIRDEPETPQQSIDDGMVWGDVRGGPGDTMSKSKRDALELELENLQQAEGYLNGQMAKNHPVRYRQTKDRIGRIYEELSTRRDHVTPLEAAMLDGMEHMRVQQSERVAQAEELASALVEIDPSYERDFIPEDITPFELGAFVARVHLAKQEWDALDGLLWKGIHQVGWSNPAAPKISKMYDRYRTAEPEKRAETAKELIHTILRSLQKKAGLQR